MKVSPWIMQVEKGVLAEDSDEETESDEYSNLPVIKSPSETA